MALSTAESARWTGFTYRREKNYGIARTQSVYRRMAVAKTVSRVYFRFTRAQHSNMQPARKWETVRSGGRGIFLFPSAEPDERRQHRKSAIWRAAWQPCSHLPARRQRCLLLPTSVKAGDHVVCAAKVYEDLQPARRYLKTIRHRDYPRGPGCRQMSWKKHSSRTPKLSLPRRFPTRQVLY